MIDKFTFFLAIVATSAAFADFLVGESGRKQIREKIVVWWVVIAESHYFGVAKKEVNHILNIMQRIFGKRLLSLKFFVSSVLISIFITTIILMIFGGVRVLRYMVYMREPDFFHGLYLGNIIGDILSLKLTMILLDRMTRTDRWFSLIFYLLIDIILAVFTFLLVFALVDFADVLVDFSFTQSQIFNFFVEHLPNGIESFLYAAFEGNWRVDDFYCWFPSVTAILPTVCHMLLILLVFATKFLTPIVRSPVLLILQRISEAKTGTVTVVVGAICAIAKLLQMALKTF